MLQFVYVAAVSRFFYHSFAASCSAWELHCNTPPQSVRSWPSPARLLEEVPSPSSSLLPGVAVLSFSLPTVPNTPLSLCFYSLSCNDKQQTSEQKPGQTPAGLGGCSTQRESQRHFHHKPIIWCLQQSLPRTGRSHNLQADFSGFHPSTCVSYLA